MSRQYDHVWVNSALQPVTPGSGHEFTRRDLAYLHHVIDDLYPVMGGESAIHVLQGSFSDVDVSAGTHTGAAAVDWEPANERDSDFQALYKAGRLGGGASYDRPALIRPDGTVVWGHHNHTLVLGTLGASSSASRQIDDYYDRRNALADHGPDTLWRPPGRITAFRYALPMVSLEVVRAEAKKTTGHKALPSVRVVQRTLNTKLPAIQLQVDGIFGRQTRRRYARWETLMGGDGDGIPAIFGLATLGGSRFRVKD